jgi:lipoprotein signal peptidase
MSDLKNIIDQEINQLIPSGYYDDIQAAVMQSIEVRKKSLQFSFSEKKDNIILFFTVIFCVSLIYFFGYSEDYKIRVYVSKELIFNIFTSIIACISVLIFLVNEFFDRKKKILI